MERSLWNTVQSSKLQNDGAFLFAGFRCCVRIIEYLEPFGLEMHGQYQSMLRSLKTSELKAGSIKNPKINHIKKGGSL